MHDGTQFAVVKIKDIWAKGILQDHDYNKKYY
jgi:hypothetical protein